MHASTADGREVPVRLVWLRPQSGWGGEISALGEDGEVALLDGLGDLDPESRRLAEEALRAHYLVPAITRVVEAQTHHGTRYLKVETGFGPREFAFKNPYVNVRPWGGDGLLIQDVIGNLFRIDSRGGLDPASRAELAKVI